MALKLQHAKIPEGKLLVGGRWTAGRSNTAMDVIYPGNAEKVASFHGASAEDVDGAVRIARQALEQGPWSTKISPAERTRILWRLSELIGEHADELAELETVNTGKPFAETRNIEIPLSAEIFQYFAGWTTKIHGETIPAKPGMLNMTLREPVGVVGVITPWNFPLLMSTWKIAAALACGNVVIHKPSELTPFTAMKLAELALEAGLPEGVLQVLPGTGGEAGEAMVLHPGIDKISFTGSTKIGQRIMQLSASNLKRLTLELGGKSPNVVFADADMDAAVRGAINAIFYNKGEVCSAGSRLLVERSIKDEFLEKVKGRAEKMLAAQGDPLSPKSRLGPQISQNQLDKVLGYIEKGQAEGARLVFGGGRNTDAGPGFFVKPTIFDGVVNDMCIAREEIFGPVLSTIAFDQVEEAAALANANDYGLAAGIWTRDIKKALRAAKALKAGTVWVNTYNVFDAAMPFGGFKNSGFGRELGMHALDNYTELKSVWIDLT
ncbi:aldehyde dehydrogenase family protein [Vulgatibacter sp.]|uniref:aldehyde dehydrogenase family protein n=1 Tax=Vulgatibacter sp. TaxID=1971226 RepID=UPI0035651A2F